MTHARPLLLAVLIALPALAGGPAARAQSAPPAALPRLSVTGVSVAEGDSGEAVASFTVELSAASAQPVSVQVATQDGTALAGDGDYRPVATTLTFEPRSTSVTVDVAIPGDLVEESDEIFRSEERRVG